MTNEELLVLADDLARVITDVPAHGVHPTEGFYVAFRGDDQVAQLADVLERYKAARENRSSRAPTYEEKHPEFLKMIEDAKRGEFEEVITFPESLGSSYAEIMTSLQHIQVAGVALRFAPDKGKS